MRGKNCIEALIGLVKQKGYEQRSKKRRAGSCVRDANRNAKQKSERSGNLYEYQVNINQAIGVFRDWLIWVIIEEDRIARYYLMSELVRCMEGG